MNHISVQQTLAMIETLCLHYVVSSTTPSDGQKSDTPKANRKGDSDKEKGKPAASSKSGSRLGTVIHYRSTVTHKNTSIMSAATLRLMLCSSVYFNS